MKLFPLGFLDFGILDLIEVSIIAVVIIYIYRWVRGSFAVPAFIGLIFIFIINALVSALGFTTIHFIIRSITNVGILAVIILFQPEIRKLLYNLGQNTSLDRFFGKRESETVIEEVIDSVKHMSRNKTGALIIFAKSSTLNDLVNVGVKLDARVSSKLIRTIFSKDTPLHDGALIIRNDRIVAASAYLPISQNPNLSTTFGTRHRAALGISESNNVLVIIVSEESGRIAIAREGSLQTGLTIQQLRDEMETHLGEGVSTEEQLSFSKSEL